MSIFDKYGIKEVFDVTFYAINETGSPIYPVLYLDTLKVSTTEETAEESTANGGKGNAPLISWDFGKDINVTIEDALFSAKSLALMFGAKSIGSIEDGLVMKTEIFTPDGSIPEDENDDEPEDYPTAGELSDIGWNPYYFGPDGNKYEKQNPKVYASNSEGERLKSLEEGVSYFVSYDLSMKGKVIDITANSFPGTYYVVGETFARSEANGEDQLFQVIFPKTKIKVDNTITLEASGDPSVFNMNLHVLRIKGGQMMRLVPYELVDGQVIEDEGSGLIHNHELNEKTPILIGKFLLNERVAPSVEEPKPYVFSLKLDTGENFVISNPWSTTFDREISSNVPKTKTLVGAQDLYALNELRYYWTNNNLEPGQTYTGTIKFKLKNTIYSNIAPVTIPFSFTVPTPSLASAPSPSIPEESPEIENSPTQQPDPIDDYDSYYDYEDDNPALDDEEND